MRLSILHFLISRRADTIHPFRLWIVLSKEKVMSHNWSEKTYSQSTRYRRGETEMKFLSYAAVTHIKIKDKLVWASTVIYTLCVCEAVISLLLVLCNSGLVILTGKDIYISFSYHKNKNTSASFSHQTHATPLFESRSSLRAKYMRAPSYTLHNRKKCPFMQNNRSR